MAGMSLDTSAPSDNQIPVAELLEMMRDPVKHQTMLAQLAEVRAGLATLAQGKAELEIREAAAAALAAEAARVKNEYLARSVGLDALREFLREDALNGANPTSQRISKGLSAALEQKFGD